MIEKLKVAPEQITYANLLYYGSWSGIAILMVTYFLNVLGIMEPYIPLTDIPNNWHQSASDFSHIFNTPMGWGWTGLLNRGDFLNFLGIAWLAGLTIFCFFALIPAYLKKNDKIYVGLVIIEILILVLAASGILGAGGH